MNRRRHLQQLAALALLGTGNAIGGLQRALAAGNNPVQAGLHTLKGTVSVNGKPARQGQAIGPGDTVDTGRNSEALYVIGRDAFLQRSDSRVGFGSTLASFMRVINGRVLAVFASGERQISFSTATIGIRGTACYIEEGLHPHTYFCLCYGSADIVCNASPDTREAISTRHHDRPLWIGNDSRPAGAIAAAPMLNHTDAELILLENLVGRWPPFYGQTDSVY